MSAEHTLSISDTV